MRAKECKRLKVALYIGDVSEKQKILLIVKQTIEWLKTVKNPPPPTIKQKYGDIPADSLYINVYKSDGRKNKSLYTNNENFICFVNYNPNRITSLKNGGLPQELWKSFYHEKMGNISIAWRQKKYITRQIIKTG